MQHLKVSGALRHIYIYIYVCVCVCVCVCVIRRLKVKGLKSDFSIQILRC